MISERSNTGPIFLRGKANLILRPTYYSVLLSIVLFFPTRFFILYHVCVAAWLMLGVVFSRSPYKTKFLLILLSTMFLILVSSTVGILFWDTGIYRNYSEIFRYLPLFFLVAFYKLFNIKLDFLMIFLSFYILCAATVSIMQLYNPDVSGFITSIYGDSHHIKNALKIGGRSIGLSSGPGQNGAISVIVCSITIAYYLSLNRAGVFGVLSLFSSFLVVMASQSQTSLISLFFILLYSVAFFILKGNYKQIKRSLSLLSFGIGSMLLFMFYYSDKLRYLLTLFDRGLERNSYQVRLEKYGEVFRLTLENIFLLIVGHGKDFFGELSRAIDNEYLFYLSVYGLIVAIIFILVYLFVIYRSWVMPFRSQTTSFVALHFAIVSGMVLAWPSSFILDPRILILLGLLWSVDKNNRINILRDNL